MIQQAQIGQMYYMGNTYNPETCVVTHLVAYADLPEDTQRRWLEMGRQRNHDARTDGYVCFTSKRKHDTCPAVCRFLPIDVFCACAHTTLRELYQHNDSPIAGMLRATLPGER